MGARRARTLARRQRPTPTAGQADCNGAAVVRRVGESAWILRPLEALEDRVVDVFRDAFLEAVDSGAQNLVVDLSDVEMIAAEGAETIVAMADLMRGRNESLWLAARAFDGAGHRLRAITEPGRSALRGVSPLLDAALDGLSLEPPGDDRERSSETFTDR